MIILKIFSIVSLLVGVYLQLHTDFKSLYWVSHLEELSKKTTDYWKIYGARSGFGYILIAIACVLWYPDIKRLLPYGILLSLIGGAGSANNMRKRQQIARKLYCNNTNEIK